MKRLLGDWITDLEGTCDLLALDGQRQRYAYFGFTPGSEKYTFYLDVANVRHTWKNGELSAYTFAPLFPENGEADEEAAAFAKKLNEEKPLYVVREDVKACLKTFGEQAIAIWKNGERIGYLALCGGNQVVEAEVLEEQDFVPALAAYLKENALDSLFISIPVYETGKAAALSEVCESFTKERRERTDELSLGQRHGLPEHLLGQKVVVGHRPSRCLDPLPGAVLHDGLVDEVKRR